MIRYGLHEDAGLSHITVTVGDEQLALLGKYVADFEDTSATGLKLGSIESGDWAEDSHKLLFDFAAANRRRKPELRESAVRSATIVLARLTDVPTLDPDPQISAYVSTAPYPGTNRWPVNAQVAWPIRPMADAVMSEVATRHMRQFAQSIRLDDYGRGGRHGLGSKFWNSNIYAHVERASGVSVQTNPIGSCAIETDGSYYDGSEPTYDLTDHNIYNSQQQLTCLAGAIALAHAAELE